MRRAARAGRRRDHGGPCAGRPAELGEGPVPERAHPHQPRDSWLGQDPRRGKRGQPVRAANGWGGRAAAGADPDARAYSEADTAADAHAWADARARDLSGPDRSAHQLARRGEQEGRQHAAGRRAGQAPDDRAGAAPEGLQPRLLGRLSTPGRDGALVGLGDDGSAADARCGWRVWLLDGHDVRERRSRRARVGNPALDRARGRGIHGVGDTVSGRAAGWHGACAVSTHVAMSKNSNRRWPWRQVAASAVSLLARLCAGVPSSRTGLPICLGDRVILSGETFWICGSSHNCGGIRYDQGAGVCEACWDPARGRPRFEETER